MSKQLTSTRVTIVLGNPNTLLSSSMNRHKILRFVDIDTLFEKCNTSQCQDQLIFGWLLSLMSLVILPQVLSLTTFAEVWSDLNRILMYGMKTHMMHLCHKFQAFCKGSLSISEYISRAGVFIDSLVLNTSILNLRINTQRQLY